MMVANSTNLILTIKPYNQRAVVSRRHTTTTALMGSAGSGGLSASSAAMGMGAGGAGEGRPFRSATTMVNSYSIHANPSAASPFAASASGATGPTGPTGSMRSMASATSSLYQWGGKSAGLQAQQVQAKQQAAPAEAEQQPLEQLAALDGESAQEQEDEGDTDRVRDFTDTANPPLSLPLQQSSHSNKSTASTNSGSAAASSAVGSTKGADVHL